MSDADIKSPHLAEEGTLKIEWASLQMPVLKLLRDKYSGQKPLKNIKIGCCLHVTSETANLMHTLKELGASIALCASNPLSTQDSVAAALVKKFNINVFAICGEDNKTYYEHIHKVLDRKPFVVLDDGGDLISTIHIQRTELLPDIAGGCEETTTGVYRFKVMEQKGDLKFPVIAVNNADTKHFFDNRYGTGQSTIDGILRATNVLLAGKNFVVSGYGWCGRGIAMRARGMGANVIVTEISPLKALEAVMDGFSVLPLSDAAKIGDIFITATGNKNVLSEKHFKSMKDGAIMANAGHFNVEINIPALNKLAKKVRNVRGMVTEYTLKSGKKLYMLAEGRLVNLVAAEGHPPTVMDMSFANQTLCTQYIIKKGKELEPKVYDVPRDIDEMVARLKLASMNIRIDTLTAEQKKYIADWTAGT